MFEGVDHVGIGVGDMETALDFYGRRLGFTEVLFDHAGSLPGLEEVTHRRTREARVVMLASAHPTPLYRKSFTIAPSRLTKMCAGKLISFGSRHVNKDRLV